MYFIGDTHGNHAAYMAIIKELKGPSIHVGDVGLGFSHFTDDAFLPTTEHRFIRGNHDNPEVCRKHPNYLGDWGMKDGVFFIGGGDSIDKSMRKAYLDWWPDEQLSYVELQRVMGNYARLKPRTVVSHCGPTSVIAEMFGGDFRPSLRSMMEEAFSQMLEVHRPEEWIFGHYHRRWTRVIKGTKFTCLNMLTPQSIGDGSMIYEVPSIKWSI